MVASFGNAFIKAVHYLTGSPPVTPASLQQHAQKYFGWLHLIWQTFMHPLQIDCEGAAARKLGGQTITQPIALADTLDGCLQAAALLCGQICGQQ